MDAVSNFDNPFELKGSLFTLTVMHMQLTDISAIERHLIAKVSQAPGFFQNVPVLIDLSRLAPNAALDFVALCDLVRGHGLIPVATQNASPSLLKAAQSAGLPSLRNTTTTDKTTDKTTSQVSAKAQPENTQANNTDKKELSAAAERSGNRFYGQPVRSGQQIYSPGGDLIIVGTVSPGAEVLADGNIHIYGALRGRALAGVQGDVEARIFCQSLEAELVSIAGNYRVFEESEAFRDKLTQAYLNQQKLIIEPLER